MKNYSSIFALFVIVALSSLASGFVPPSRTTNTRTTQLRESIIEAEDRYLETAMNAPPNQPPDVVYTIVYNPGTPEEGIHTMKYPRSDPQQDILFCFEGMADCIVFARTITEDPALDQEPIPTPTSRQMIQQACEGMGMQMVIVPMETQTQW